jgi:OFA family oxalate/formate antiporter-like MFS transporter
MSYANALHDEWLHVRRRHVSRWVQLVLGTVVMMVIASALYVWPLVRSHPGAELGKSLVSVESAFATFLYAETLFVPLEAWLGERKRTRLLLLLGVVLVALGALAGARAETLQAQMGWYALGGAGAGLVYGGTVARVVKRFTDRKAMCVGVTAAACAAVLALALLAYVRAITAPGAIGVLVLIGAGQAIVVVIATLFILKPPPADGE